MRRPAVGNASGFGNSTYDVTVAHESVGRLYYPQSGGFERTSGRVATATYARRVPVIATTTYAPAQPVDLASTLAPLRRGSGDPTFRSDPSGVWRTQRTPEGPATLRLEQNPNGVRATAWGPGAHWTIAAVPELLGA